MAELVDAYVSGAYIERCAGSTPVRGTEKQETLIDYQSVRVFLWGKTSHYLPTIYDGEQKSTPQHGLSKGAGAFKIPLGKSAAKIHFFLIPATRLLFRIILNKYCATS